MENYDFFQGRKAEEQRAQRLAAEMAQYRHEAERRLQEKDEEIEAIRYDDDDDIFLIQN